MTKVAVRAFDPMLAAMGRAAAAAMLAAAVLLVRGVGAPSRRALPQLMAVVVGVLVGFPVLTAYALREVPASHGAVVTGLLPLGTAGAAVLRAGDRPSARYWACSIVGLGAVVAFAVGEGGGSLHLADGLLLAAVVAAAVGYTEGALLARTMPGWQVISWALILGAPITVGATASLLAAGSPTSATVGEWIAFGYT
ncbi:MAG: EamA family transporter, partial [Actinomycetota bacterium]|nr:EamA family transporter [Actinomycetota bacterium]